MGYSARHDVLLTLLSLVSWARHVSGERAELIAGPVLGDQALTVDRAELAPQPADVNVDRTAAGPCVRPARRFRWLPHALDAIRAAEHHGRMRAEEGQQLELLEGQRDLAVVGPDPALHAVDEQPARVRLAGGRALRRGVL